MLRIIDLVVSYPVSLMEFNSVKVCCYFFQGGVDIMLDVKSVDTVMLEILEHPLTEALADHTFTVTDELKSAVFRASAAALFVTAGVTPFTRITGL